MKSKLGLLLASIYVVIAAYFILTQGLFGESFIAIVLGMPWSLVLALIEFGNASGPVLYALILAPIVLNTFLLYWIGHVLGKFRRMRQPAPTQTL